MQLLLSLKTLHITIGIILGIRKFRDWISDGKILTVITSESAAESTMYYASVVLSAIKGCMSEDHIIGLPANMRTYPGLNTRPLLLVLRKYLHMRLTDSSWYLEGELQNLAHCFVAMVLSGLNIIF